MGVKELNIVYESSVERLTEINSSFDKGVLRVAYTGKNRNKSFISKDTFEKCINTIYNVPIVCNYNRETDSIGAHDVDVVKTSSGIKLINITQPVGVVPESANYWWEIIEEDNGDIHEYLCVDIIIWKRQEAYAKIKENRITDESMEIKVNRGHTDDGYYHIDSFEFTAFCLLESAEPCYESACVEVFSLDSFRSQYTKMMNDFKEHFSEVKTSKEDDIKNKSLTQNLSKGGSVLLGKMELLSAYGLTLADLDFDINDFTIDELKEKFEANKKKNKTDDSDNDNPASPTTSAEDQSGQSGSGSNGESGGSNTGSNDSGSTGGAGDNNTGNTGGSDSGSNTGGSDSGNAGSNDSGNAGSNDSGNAEGGNGESTGSNDNGNSGDSGTSTGGNENGDNNGGDNTGDSGAFSLTAEQFLSQLLDALCSVTYNDPYCGDVCRYLYVDYDCNVSEVYCYDCEDWKLYGFSYSMNGDNVVIDFDSRKRKKFSIVDFDEGSSDFNYEYAFDKYKRIILESKDAELNSVRAEYEEKCSNDSKTIKDLQSELTSLKQYQKDKLDEERREAESELFARFSDLDGVEAFESLRENCSEMSLEDIENKCFEIKGRNVTLSFSAKKPKTVRIAVEKKNNSENEPYGGLFVEYPPTNN